MTHHRVDKEQAPLGMNFGRSLWEYLKLAEWAIRLKGGSWLIKFPGKPLQVLVSETSCVFWYIF